MKLQFSEVHPVKPGKEGSRRGELFNRVRAEAKLFS